MSRIKECFVSRWGEHGSIVEVDFSQLEVIGLAHLSGDEVLTQDILDGKDMHCVNAAFLYNEDYDVIRQAYLDEDPLWVKRRGIAKGPGFLIQYGGGAALMAENTGLPKADCQTFIDNYYKRYEGVANFQEWVADTVKSSRRPTSMLTEKGVTKGVGEWINPTGRILRFYEYDAPEFAARKGQLTSFSPTQMKNYPIQSFATGDLVTMMLGVVHYKILPLFNRKALLVNTVHDSIILDVHDSVLDECCSWIKGVLEDTPKWYKYFFEDDFTLPLHVDVEHGKNWAQLTKWVEKI